MLETPDSNITMAPRPPSRLDNPFATCWTRPGAIPFHFAGSLNLQLLIAKLAAQNRWGSIIGPHGSGKSTLLETMKPALLIAGFDIHAVSLRDRQHTLPHSFAAEIRACNAKSIIVVDGYEQLSWLSGRRVVRGIRRAGAGLLVTSHQPTNIPALVSLSPNRNLIEELVSDLRAKVSTPITLHDIAASHAC